MVISDREREQSQQTAFLVPLQVDVAILSDCAKNQVLFLILTANNTCILLSLPPTVFLGRTTFGRLGRSSATTETRVFHKCLNYINGIK